MSSSENYIHLPAGFLIVQDGVSVGKNNEYYRKFGSYWGVDRLPAFLPPDDDIRESVGASAAIEEREALEEWFERLDGGSPFISDRPTAVHLLGKLRKQGHALELLVCERTVEANSGIEKLAGQPNSEIAETYGYDVSWPSCTHSAILQPGVVPENPVWRSRLNRWGLLRDPGIANTLRDEYLKVYPYPPFEIYRVGKARE